MSKFFFLVCLLFASLFPAVGQSQSNDPINYDIHYVCQNDYALCLEILPGYLISSVPKSRLWYTYKLYQVEALFALEKYSSLRKELEGVIHWPDLPTKFKLHSLVLYAKLIKYEGQTELALKYLNEAKDVLMAVNKEWPKPMELIQVANFMNSMEQYQLGYEMLLGVEKKFASYDEPVFRYQLFTNLGHFALRLDDHDKHIDYRKKAVEWTTKATNSNHRTIALFNLARAYFFVERDEESLRYFKETIPVAKKARNSSIEDKCYINMADIFFRQGREADVERMLEKVDVSTLEGSYEARYLALEKKLGIKKAR